MKAIVYQQRKPSYVIERKSIADGTVEKVYAPDLLQRGIVEGITADDCWKAAKELIPAPVLEFCDE